MNPRKVSSQDILKAFVAASQALSAAENEPQLLREFCLALVKHSGVLSASVGDDAGGGRFRPLVAVWGGSESPRVVTYSASDWDLDVLISCSAFAADCELVGYENCGVGELKDWEERCIQSQSLGQVCIPVLTSDGDRYVLRLSYHESEEGVEERESLLYRLADVLAVALSALRARDALAAEQRKLSERMKELECLLALQKHFGGLVEIGEKDWDFLVNRIPSAFCYPDQTGVRLTLGDVVYASDCLDGCGVEGACVAVAHNEEVFGKICVCVRGGRKFEVLPEEERLLESIASLVGAVIARTKARNQAEALRARLVATFEETAAGIAHVSPDGSFIRVNARFGEIAGWPGKQLVGKTFQEITHPDDLNKDLELVRRLKRGEIPHYSMRKR